MRGCEKVDDEARIVDETPELESSELTQHNQIWKWMNTRVGAVADVILAVAEEMQVDVIAMSTHGRTGPARWLLGSVAERVVRNSSAGDADLRQGLMSQRSNLLSS